MSDRVRLDPLVLQCGVPQVAGDGAAHVLVSNALSAAQNGPAGRARLKDVVAESEKAHILNTLNLTGGNRTKAAELLGISRKNLWEKMKAYRLL